VQDELYSPKNRRAAQTDTAHSLEEQKKEGRGGGVGGGGGGEEEE